MWKEQGKSQHCNRTAWHGAPGKRVCGYAVKGRRTASTQSRAHCRWWDISYSWKTCNRSIFTVWFWAKGRGRGYAFSMNAAVPHLDMLLQMSTHHTTIFKGPVDLRFLICVCRSQHHPFPCFLLYFLNTRYPLVKGVPTACSSSQPIASSPFCSPDMLIAQAPYLW